MGHDLEKKYYEYLAKRVLETALPRRYPELIPGDRPDLCCPATGEGVEVTRLFPRREPGRPQAAQPGEEGIFWIKGDRVVGWSPRRQGTEDLLTAAGTAYREKLVKLQKYRPCASYALFCFTPYCERFSREEMELLAHRLGEEPLPGPAAFSTLYVFDHTSLYGLELAEGNVSQILLGERVLDCCVEADGYARQITGGT